jgi:hypothetical protein
MKLTLPVALALAVAFGVGYLVGHSRSHSPSAPAEAPGEAKNTRWERFVEGTKSEDQITTSLSLYALRRLERGEIEPTKAFLASRIAHFYLSHGPPGGPRTQLDEAGLELLEAVHSFSQTNLVLQAALKKRANGATK